MEGELSSPPQTSMQFCYLTLGADNQTRKFPKLSLTALQSPPSILGIYEGLFLSTMSSLWI